jgi:hypothetical protein
MKKLKDFIIESRDNPFKASKELLKAAFQKSKFGRKHKIKKIDTFDGVDLLTETDAESIQYRITVNDESFDGTPVWFARNDTSQKGWKGFEEASLLVDFTGDPKKDEKILSDVIDKVFGNWQKYAGRV